MNEAMRAVVVTRFGGPDVLAVREVPKPEPGPGEVRVRVAVSGVNRADLLQRMGRYPAPAGWPQEIPGLEFTGVVDALGPGTRAVAVGDRVMGIVGGGGYAEYVTTHASTLVPVPEALGPEESGAVPEAFMTAFDAVFRRDAVKRGETLLIHAVGSGVGTAALQLGLASGARVIGTSRTSAKLERARALGLEHAVDGGGDWPAEVMSITAGVGADVILDLVGGPYLSGNQSVLASLGRHVVVGVPGGPRAEVDLRALMSRRGSIRGTVLRARPVAEKAELARLFEERVCPLLAAGTVRPVVDSVFTPEEAGDAHTLVADNTNFGKVLLRW